jgi:hypothetical protein
MPRAERSRKNEATILQGLARAGQVHVAEFMGVSESAVSRLKSERLVEISDFITACGLKVVPQEMQCYRPASIAALIELARERMEELTSPEQLVWEGE